MVSAPLAAVSPSAPASSRPTRCAASHRPLQMILRHLWCRHSCWASSWGRLRRRPGWRRKRLWRLSCGRHTSQGTNAQNALGPSGSSTAGNLALKLSLCCLCVLGYPLWRSAIPPARLCGLLKDGFVLGQSCRGSVAGHGYQVPPPKRLIATYSYAGAVSASLCAHSRRSWFRGEMTTREFS